MTRKRLLCAVLLIVIAAEAVRAGAQGGAGDPSVQANVAKERLQFVVIVSRHGVRSPTGKLDELNRYSRKPWPTWSVPPGYLTEHGAHLMTLLGNYDRQLLASEGLLGASGCEGSSSIRIVADSDQRTRESAKSLAEGLAPGCHIEVKAQADGIPDALFHALHAGVGQPDYALARQSVAGRIGGNADGLAEAYRQQLDLLEDVLNGCDRGHACTETSGKAPESLFSVPSSIKEGRGDHLVELRSPLNIASTMAENLLLEYAEGYDAAQVGWGHVDLRTLRMILQLHTAQSDVGARSSYIAKAGASNLLAHILSSMEHAAEGHTVNHALTREDDRVLVLMGHDTNLSNISGALNLSWLIDGRRDDTPPGGALVFELWQNAQSKAHFVRVYYRAQTLDQMRTSAQLSLANPPERVAVFLPGCSGADASCEWSAFKKNMQEAIDPGFVR